MKNMAWYPVKVKGGQEEKVKLRIQDAFKEKGMEEMLGDIIAPFQRVYTVQTGKKIIKKRYFAYVVVMADLGDNNKLKKVILDVDGVRGYISDAGWGPTHEPTPLQQEEIDMMLGNQIPIDTMDDDVRKSFKEGEKVKIIDGALKGIVAVIRKLDVNSKKVEAAIQMFGKETTATLTFAQVEKQ